MKHRVVILKHPAVGEHRLLLPADKRLIIHTVKLYIARLGVRRRDVGIQYGRAR